ncbi:MAG: methyl-accepting chemotaxis sensory transducer [Firmicutes bacterium]|nr:methyl-accepting chemotaxis sensory transducer [Bacillota bacterium]
MKVKTKIVSGYAVISTFILIVTVISLYGFNQVRTNYEAIINESDATVITLREIQYYFTGQANDERGFLLTGGTEFKGEIQQKSDKVKQDIEKLKPLMNLPEEKEALAQLDSAHTKFTNINLKVIELYNQGKNKEAQELSFGEGRKLRKDLEASFNGLIKIQEQETVENRSEADDYSNRIKLIVVITSVLMIILGTIFGMILSRNIVNPIHKITEDMKSGNLNFAELVTTKDEIGELTKEFGNMVKRLHNMVLSIKNTADQVADLSQELTASAEQSAQAATQVAEVVAEVANGADKQLASVNYTRNTVQQMDDHMQQITQKVSTVSDSSDRTAKAADDGLSIVETSITQMSAIDKAVNTSSKIVLKLGERSNEIGQIVDTISGIAGQTNLLALNAAIEAARAGEQGKGFSVVADEVRKLAEQSQDAAKQIAALIGTIQSETNEAVTAMNEGDREVKAGTEIVAYAGESFKEIVSLVNEVSTQVNEISSAVKQLSSGSKQIVASVEQVETVTKDTAAQTQTVSAATEEQSASMEEIAASSENLANMAEQLKEIIRGFKIYD